MKYFEYRCSVKCNINGMRVVYSTDSTELSSTLLTLTVHGQVSNHPLDKLYLTLIVISIHNNRPVHVAQNVFTQIYTKSIMINYWLQISCFSSNYQVTLHMLSSTSWSPANGKPLNLDKCQLSLTLWSIW